MRVKARAFGLFCVWVVRGLMYCSATSKAYFMLWLSASPDWAWRLAAHISHAKGPSMENALFDLLLNHFCRAACGTLDWPRALYPMRLIWPSSAPFLFQVKHPARSMRLLCPVDSGDDAVASTADVLGLGWDFQAALDVVLRKGGPAFLEARAGAPMWCAQVMSADEDNAAATVLGLQLAPSHGPVGEATRQSLYRLSAHLHKLLPLAAQARRVWSAAAAVRPLLDRVALPVCLISLDRRILCANESAHDELSSGCRWTDRDGLLVLARSRLDRIFAEQLRMLAGASAIPATAVDLRDNAMSAPIWLHVVRLAGDDEPLAQEPLLLASLFDPANRSELDPDSLSSLLGLSLTEARVAARAADGLSAPAIASLHGVRECTIRTHIRSVNLKLGAERLVDVVRMLRQNEMLWARPARRRKGGSVGGLT